MKKHKKQDDDAAKFLKRIMDLYADPDTRPTMGILITLSPGKGGADTVSRMSFGLSALSAVDLLAYEIRGIAAQVAKRAQEQKK